MDLEEAGKGRMDGWWLSGEKVLRWMAGVNRPEPPVVEDPTGCNALVFFSVMFFSVLFSCRW